MKSMKADSSSDPMRDIDRALDKLTCWRRSEIKFVKRHLESGIVVVDPTRVVSLIPSYSPCPIRATRDKKVREHYDKSEGKYNKSER